MKNQKNMKICIRVDESTYADLAMAAQDRGVKVSTFVREVVETNGKVSRPVTEFKVAKEILTELIKEGNNLNQITRELNKYGLNNENLKKTYDLVMAFGRQRIEFLKVMKGGVPDGVHGTDKIHAERSGGNNVSHTKER